MFLLYFIQKYLRTSIRTSEAEIAGKIRTSRLSEKKGVLIRKKRCTSSPSPISLSCCRNELERQFLELLQFNINVPSSVYAKYYFDLRALAEANDLAFPTEPLNKERAVKLEALSSVIEDKFRDIHKVIDYRGHGYIYLLFLWFVCLM